MNDWLTCLHLTIALEDYRDSLSSSSAEMNDDFFLKYAIDQTIQHIHNHTDIDKQVLLDWINKAADDALINSAITHYNLEYCDGYQRLEKLIQNY